MKDLYKVLKVSSTASQKEIKDAYRKLALALHPDRHAGCEIKSSEFKNATEAYQTLSDRGERSNYDIRNNHKHSYNGTRARPPPRNHRKVYAPRPPQGFKTFDAKRHYDMHYGDGMMEEAMERILRRQRGGQPNPNERTEDQEYVSPLGSGFKFSGSGGGVGGGAGSRARRKKPDEYGYEEAFVDLQSSPCRAQRVMRTREMVTIRMQERRKERMQNQRRGFSYKNEEQPEESSVCAVM